MGSGGAKKKNALLEEQQRLAQEASKEAGEFKRDQYQRGAGREDWAAQKLMEDMWGAYGTGAGGEEGGGGGGGGGGGIAEPGFDKYGWKSETMPFYRDLMKTGGLSEQERGAIESSATAPITGIFGGLQRDLESRAAGGGGGYGRNFSNLALDKAYAASEASKGAFGDIAKMVQAAKERGAGGLTGLETEQRGLEVSERDKAYQVAKEAAANARAAANAGRARQSAREQADYARQMGIIGALTGMGDTSLQWGGQQLAGVGEGRQSATARVDETPLWMKTAASMLPAAASAAAGAFTGGLAPIAGKLAGGLLKKKGGGQYSSSGEYLGE